MNFKGLPPARTMRGQDGLYDLEFESDIDHAIYFAGKPVAGTGKERSADQKEALEWLNSLGLSYGDILDSRKKLLEIIRSIPSTPGSGDLFVPATDIARQYGEGEDTPVFVEVFESKQTNDDDPAVITIEAPFENPQQLPRRIKLPKRFLKNKRDNRTTADRMADAFDSRLDDLLDAIKQPDTTTPPRRRKKPQGTPIAQKKRVVKATPVRVGEKNPAQAKSFNEYVGLKIQNAFSKAAGARKEFVDQGGDPEQLAGKNRFIWRALGFEFGGDKLARTRGTFSTNPSADMDPANTRQQRFRAGINNMMTPAPAPEQQATPADAGVAPPNLEPLTDSYSNIIEAFGFTQASQQEETKKEKAGASILDQISSQIDETLALLGEKNKVKGESVQVRIDKLRFKADAADDLEAQTAEKKLEGKVDTAKINKTLLAGGGGGGILSAIINFITGNGGDTPGDGPSDGNGGGILGDIALEIARKKLAGLGAKAGGMTAGAAAGIVGGVGLAASGLGEGLFQLTRDGEGPINEALKGTGVALDAVGAPFRYAVEAIRYPFLNKEDREKQATNLAKFDSRIREYTRGWMNQIDFMDVIPDEKGAFGNIYGDNEAQQEMMEKMSEGRAPKLDVISGPRLTGQPAMVGEAGKELVGTEKQLEVMANTAQDSVSPGIRSLLGVTKNIIDQTGVVGAAIRPFIEQFSAPIIKTFGIDKFNFTPDIGKGIGSLKAAADEKQSGNFITNALNFFLGGDNKSDGLPAKNKVASGKTLNLGLSQKEAYKKIYDMAVKVGGAKHPHLVASIAMLETGWLTQVAGNNPFNQRDTSGKFIEYDSMEDSVRDHIKFWHKTDKFSDNANAFADPNEAWANLVNTYAPAADNNNPESYKQSVANMMTTMQGEVGDTTQVPPVMDTPGDTPTVRPSAAPQPVAASVFSPLATTVEETPLPSTGAGIQGLNIFQLPAQPSTPAATQTPTPPSEPPLQQEEPNIFLQRLALYRKESQ